MEEKIQVVRFYRRQENGMYDVPISGGESHATVYLKAAKRSIPCAPLISLNGSTVISAAVERLAYN